MTTSLTMDVDGCLIPINMKTGEPELLQTWWHEDPWRVCVTSLLLVATRRSQVQPMLSDFYRTYPSPLAVLDLPEAMPRMTEPLGLAAQRTARIMAFSADYLEGKAIRRCFGVGPYVEAAYRLVHLKDEYAITEDKVLQLYRAWLRSLEYDPLRWA